MLTFLVPSALFAACLLAIPIVVHLFRPRKMRQTPFSSLRWLRISKQRLSRRIQWHQMLLFLLRAGFILLLVLALARPLWSPPAAGRFVDRYVIVDVSRSMGCKVGDRPTPLEKARAFAASLVGHASISDRTALLLTDTQTRIVTPPTFNPRAFLPELQAVKPGLGETDLGSALTVLRPMLAQTRPGADVELYFLTDNHQQSWAQADIAAFVKDLNVPVHVEVVDCGITGASNGWIAHARLLPSDASGRRTLRIEVGYVGESPQERTVRVTGLGAIGERSHAVTLEPGQPTVVDFEMPPEDDWRGQLAEVRLEPFDALPDDDRHFVHLGEATGAPRVLLVDAEETADEKARSGFFLRSAIESLYPDAPLVVRGAANVTRRQIEEANVILLAGVPELADEVVEALEARVRAGAGLVVFLGDAVKQRFYNERLYRPARPSDGLLPCSLRTRETSPGADAALTDIRWSQRLLAAQKDPVLGDLARVRFRHFYRFENGPAETDQVLAWIDGEAPAIVERTLGSGKVVLFNNSADDSWSTLPRGKSFVSLVDQLLRYLGGATARAFEVGEAAVLPLPAWQQGESVTVHTPDGSTLAPVVATVDGQPVLRMPPLPLAGVYRVKRSSGKESSFVVNVGRGDSVLTPLDAAILAQWWRPVPCEVRGPDDAARRLDQSGSALPLWPWLVGLGAVLLLLETYFVHRLCPRANPTTAQNIVHRRGLLRPLETPRE